LLKILAHFYFPVNWPVSQSAEICLTTCYHRHLLGNALGAGNFSIALAGLPPVPLTSCYNDGLGFVLENPRILPGIGNPG
jgi:hypothetical protein